MSNYYISTKEHPYHLSVGAVVINDKSEVLCHHFHSIEVPGTTFKDLYLLVRESLEPDESLEAAVRRGLLEEAGVEAAVQTYLGSIVSQFNREDIIAQKTTTYFLCKLISIDTSKREPTDPEAGSEITFLPIDDLIGKMKSQFERYKRSDFDETYILEETKKYL
ncbi:MAG: NUDIX hydrolase [Patescibacteria group bacterium]